MSCYETDYNIFLCVCNYPTFRLTFHLYVLFVACVSIYIFLSRSVCLYSLIFCLFENFLICMETRFVVSAKTCCVCVGLCSLLNVPANRQPRYCLVVEINASTGCSLSCAFLSLGESTPLCFSCRLES